MTEVASAAAAAAIRQSGSGSTGDPPTVTEPTNTLTADFETFLRLLTTQMQNQDPLQPMESTEFVTQLAQFSSVEQQVETNKQLESILERLSGSSAAELSQWLGREVLVEAPLSYQGGAVELRPAAAEMDAVSGTLVVTDADGAVAAEVSFTPGDDSVTWDGKLASGEDAPPGKYAFSARYGDGSGATETATAQRYALVREARMGVDGVDLTLDGGVVVAADSVSGVREAQPAG
jgi:flagellar basal-body rod modification protein FlgD